MGGKRLQYILRNAGKGGVKSIDVGVFDSAKYQDGTYVATSAAKNEFGSRKIPSRPFIRNANTRLETRVPNTIRRLIDPKKMIIDRHLADTLGAMAQGEIQDEIRNLREPPNSPETIKRKGSDNPLIDTSKLRRSITWRKNA